MAEISNSDARTNPYRYGVLEGNHAEDRFGLDLLNSNQSRRPTPASTMKDDFRWYNSALFHQREQILAAKPELAAQIHNNPSLKHNLQTPAHILNQESYRNKPAAGQSTDQFTKPAAKLMVCCPTEDNMTRHGMKATETAVNNLNAPENGRKQTNQDRKNFSQYGGWIVNAHQGRTSMYTRDREGVIDQAPPPGVKPDVQAASCNKHLLFGHGPHLSNFKSRDFDTVTSLAIDQKVRSKLFLDPHYDPKTQTVATSAQLAKTHAQQEWAAEHPGSGNTAPSQVGVSHVQGTQTKSELLTGPSGHIKRYGEVENLLEARKTTGFKFYNDFTKRFDQPHLNTELRAPHYLRH